jgi:sulfide:quinone oxidoreductase
MKTHYEVLIIGGGTAGIMTAAQLRNHDKKIDIGIIEPSEHHYYQAAWTLVGAGTYDFQQTRRNEKDLIPSGVAWIKDYATGFAPEQNTVHTQNSGNITYDYLIVAPGIQYDLDGITGLREALETPEVVSNYIDPNKTWKAIKSLKQGNAVFTQPTTPIKCGGAPQKIAYLASDFFRKRKMDQDVNVVFATPGSVIFGVKEFAGTLMQVIDRYGIYFKTFYAPHSIDHANKSITFHHTQAGENGCIINQDPHLKEEIQGESFVTMPYDLLHLAPPQKAPDFVGKSPLAHQEGPSKGWMNVDIHTLQHKQFRNVFGLGDVAALPTAKTGAAVRKQAPVVTQNILHMRKNNTLSTQQYSGYSSCPLVTGYGKMVLAEFKYDNVRDSDPTISMFMDTSKEQYSMWLLKKYGLPYLYWNRMMKGKM